MNLNRVDATLVLLMIIYVFLDAIASSAQDSPMNPLDGLPVTHEEGATKVPLLVTREIGQNSFSYRAVRPIRPKPLPSLVNGKIAISAVVFYYRLIAREAI